MKLAANVTDADELRALLGLLLSTECPFEIAPASVQIEQAPAGSRVFVELALFLTSRPRMSQQMAAAAWIGEQLEGTVAAMDRDRAEIARRRAQEAGGHGD